MFNAWLLVEFNSKIFHCYLFETQYPIVKPKTTTFSSNYTHKKVDKNLQHQWLSYYDWSTEFVDFLFLYQTQNEVKIKYLCYSLPNKYLILISVYWEFGAH